MVVLLLIFKEPPYCFPQWLRPLAPPPTVHEGSLLATSSPALVVFCLISITAILAGVRYLTVVLTCFSLMISDVEHPSTYMLATCMSLEKCLFRSFAQRLVVFLLSFLRAFFFSPTMELKEFLIYFGY